jgi:glycosyltransferase involved in cell wall biosynthesis
MAPRRLRILHALGTMDPGGVETWLLNVLKYIDRDRLEFHFCTFGEKPGLFAGEVERLGGRMVPCPRGLNPWSFSRRFRGILREGKYDAVHSHVTFFSGAVLRWAKAEGIPMRIAHSHASQDDKPNTHARRYYRRMMKSWIGDYATHGLAVSESAASLLFGENWQEDSRFRKFYYGLDLRAFQEPFDRHEVRKEIGLPIDGPVVGHVANFLPVKNHSFTLGMAAEILKTRPEVHFLFVGDGPLRPRIQSEASARGLSSQTHFVGTRTDVPRLMLAAMDVVVFPSLHEGFGLCLLEAQAAGLHCLVSDTVPVEVARIPESIEFLSLLTGETQWARQVVEMLDARQPGLTPGINDVTRQQFSMEQSVRELTNIYVLGQKSILPNLVQQHA